MFSVSPRMDTKLRSSKETSEISTLDETSSLNKHFKCDFCKKNYKTKGALVKHVRHCIGDEWIQNLTCQWCHLKFTNKGNLIQHYHIHGDNRLKIPNTLKRFQCNACHCLFTEVFPLTCHQRKEHYNLKYRATFNHTKKINEIWCETVSNSDMFVQIRKISSSTLLMKPIYPNTDIKVEIPSDNFEDLQYMYPIGQKRILVSCKICNKQYVKRNLSKHIRENHYNIRKYRCLNCNVSYKRSYQFLRHVCSKAKRRRVRGVTQFDDNIKIASVQSLASPD